AKNRLTQQQNPLQLTIPGKITTKTRLTLINIYFICYQSVHNFTSYKAPATSRVLFHLPCCCFSQARHAVVGEGGAKQRGGSFPLSTSGARSVYPMCLRCNKENVYINCEISCYTQSFVAMKN